MGAMPLLITGATGFVGRHLTKRRLAQGAPVRILVRSPDKARNLAALGAEIAQGDVTDPASLHKALDGVSAVIHLAGAADVADAAVNEAVNVGGARNLAEACKRAGVRRVLHFSSHCAGRKLRDAYGETKRRGEEVLLASGLDVTVFRPTMIVGPGSKEWATFVRVIRRLPVVPIVGTGKT
ncbi:MAG: NAD(P)H-binding protein, partial [Candidatus Methylomirabilis sp.]|nr:NAD(P)H-binding protein [Deltaproteobacteria bacterium]